MYQTQNGTRPAKNALKWEEKHESVYAFYDSSDLERLDNERARAIEYLRENTPKRRKGR
jgi:hypothetical protein